MRCATCGKTIYGTPYKRDSDGVYCSKRCYESRDDDSGGGGCDCGCDDSDDDDGGSSDD
jgi:hypothetical protein